MRMDSKGDMGFGEAIVATIAVVIVFNILFVTILSDQSSDSNDPGIDQDLLAGSVVDGVFVPEFTNVIQEHIDRCELNGMMVLVRFPGGLYGDVTVEVGDKIGDPYVQRHASTVTDDHGCRVAVVYEVTSWS